MSKRAGVFPPFLPDLWSVTHYRIPINLWFSSVFTFLRSSTPGYRESCPEFSIQLPILVFLLVEQSFDGYKSTATMEFLTSEIDSLTIANSDNAWTESKPRNRKTKHMKEQISESHQASYSYPEYHAYVSDEVPLMSWHGNAKRSSFIHEYDTNIMGSFTCTNARCKKNGWSSKKIAINIRYYYGNRYNAIVYNQRCKDCNSLGSMSVDISSYTERVAYRLNKWLGLPVETPQHSGESKGPHQKSLCEGCKAGHCSEGNTTKFWHK